MCCSFTTHTHTHTHTYIYIYIYNIYIYIYNIYIYNIYIYIYIYIYQYIYHNIYISILKSHSIELLCNFIKIPLRHGCSPVNLLHISRTPFLRTPLDSCFCKPQVSCRHLVVQKSTTETLKKGEICTTLI